MTKWIFQGKRMKATHHWDEGCVLCNQWIEAGEEMYLIIPPMELKKQYRFDNPIAHADEWDAFTEGLTDEQIAKKLHHHKKPRRKPLTNEQQHRVECYKAACIEHGFNKEVVSRNKRYFKMKKAKTSLTIIYDAVYNKLTYSSRKYESIFDSMFITSKLTNIENSLKEKLGIEDRNDFTVAGAIKEAIKETDKMMGRKTI